MINLMLSVEDVACPVDDMRERSFGWGDRVGKGEQGLRYKIIDGLSEGMAHDKVGGARLWTLPVALRARILM